MRLLFKFNIIFIITFVFGFSITAYISYQLLQKSAQQQVLDQANLMMETALANRSYTSNQVAPLLKSQRSQISDVLSKYQQSLQAQALTTPPAGNAQASSPTASSQQINGPQTTDLPKDPNQVFYPQTVPAYAATETFNYLHKKYVDYSYKEATLNPTNLRDKASDWETDIINAFRNDPDKTTLSGKRENEGLGETLYLAHPIKITNPSCLECHSTPDKAPAAMTKLYGNDNGFNWQLNDVVGAQIIQVPVSLPQRLASEAFDTLIFSLVGVFVLILLILNLALYFTVIRPVAQLSTLANAISQGDLHQAEAPIRGKDEISVLANSFNRMRRSLVKAIEMLEK